MQTLNDKIIELRNNRRTIVQIAAQLNISITDVCIVLYNQNNKDKQGDVK